MYPSFDPVSVFVVRFGDGYRVHDGGGALHSAWVHGRDDPLIRRMLNRYAGRYQIKVSDDTLVADAPSLEWLAPAILAVANASAATAHAAVEHFVAATEGQLKDRILSVLKSTISLASIHSDFVIVGKSGKTHHFDFGLTQQKDIVLIDAVAPHHISISSKYVAFADTGMEGDYPLIKFAVHDRPLAPDDISLLSQVADLVPFQSLRPGLKRSMNPSLFQ
jgi:hypothetical protein